MTFLNFFMIVGALAAGIPVAIHLFFRSRYRTVPWAAMKFLLTSVEQTSRRLKFQEYLLLLLRMMVLTLIAVAFMRPINLTIPACVWILLAAILICLTLSWWTQCWSAKSFLMTLVNVAVSYAVLFVLWVVLFALYPFMTANPGAVVRGRGDAVDAVFVFDLSYSMGAKDQDGKTRLKLAQEEAHKIITELPPHSTVRVITCAGKDRAVLGEHAPSDMALSRKIIDELEIAHLNTDLQQGVGLAAQVIKSGQASNKELYVFSDMQKMGFEQQEGELKKTLLEIKEKAVVHLVRCGMRTPKNVAIVDIKPQSGVPRPGERVAFAVLVRNSGADVVENIKVSLLVDGDDKNVETTAISKIKPSETLAVTLTGKLEKPGPRVLTATLATDELEPDNHFDQVVFVRDQVNVLVVDGNFKEREPVESSSYFLMHALLAQEGPSAPPKHNARVISARLASPALLAKMDVCILVNCSLKARPGRGTDVLPADFAAALAPFVKDGHSLIIFSGDLVDPAPYNEVFFHKLGLLPMPLKGVVKAGKTEPFFVNRSTFAGGPASFRQFANEKYFLTFDLIGVWQHMDLDESAAPPKVEKPVDKEPEPKREEKKDEDKKAEEKKGEENPVTVLARLDSGKPFAVSKKVDSGEVIFVTTAVNYEGRDPKTNLPNWTDFHNIGAQLLAPLVPFVHVSVAHLMHEQTQTYNLIAGQPLNWYPTDKLDHIYSLVHPDKKVERLNPPETVGKRVVVTKKEISRAGVYYMVSHPRVGEGEQAIDPAAAVKLGAPIAVIPDLTESADLTAFSDKELTDRIGFVPIFITAGVGPAEAASTGADRSNREWTVWVLLAVLMLVLLEVAFAWWCGRGW